MVRYGACPELVEGDGIPIGAEEKETKPVLSLSNVERADLSGTGAQTSPDSPQATVLDVSDYKTRRIPSKTWRELIKKIREVDPLSCPRRGHEMKIISLINDPDVIKRILRHLGLWKQQTASSEGKTKAPEHGPLVIEDFDDGWPGYEEPVIVYH